MELHKIFTYDFSQLRTPHEKEQRFRGYGEEASVRHQTKEE